MITQTAEYALRAVAHLALHFDRPCTTQEIAEATLVPKGYLAKILKELAKVGLVSSQRGPSGGFQLTRPPEEIPVLAVVDEVSPLQRIRECPLGLKEHARLCPLHKLLDDAMAGVEAAFAEVMISDLVRSSRSSDPVLCNPADTLVKLNGPRTPRRPARQGDRTRRK